MQLGEPLIWNLMLPEPPELAAELLSRALAGSGFRWAGPSQAAAASGNRASRMAERDKISPMLECETLFGCSPVLTVHGDLGSRNLD